MNGWYEAIMVYNAGYNTFDLSMMDVGSQVFMMLCMWATGRPFTLGILVTAAESSTSAADADDSEGVDDIDVSRGSTWTVLRELVMLLRSDLIVLVICTLMICMYDNTLMDNGHFTGPDVSIGTGSYIGVFPVAFDLSSAYGNVGLSLGFPNTVTSSSAVLSPFSKLVVIFMCMHGYCMGIFPASVAAMELPEGAEGPLSGDEDAGAAAAKGAAGARDDVDLLREAAPLTDALTSAQLLGVCEAALQSPLASVARASTAALTQAEVAAGAAVGALVAQLSEEGKVAFCALILTRRVRHLGHAADERGGGDGGDDGGAAGDGAAAEAAADTSLGRRNGPGTAGAGTIGTAGRGATERAKLGALFAESAPAPAARRASIAGGGDAVLGRRGGQSAAPSRRAGGRGF